MAEVLESFPAVVKGLRGVWAKYLDGRVYRLKAGEDFTSKSMNSVRTSLCRVGREHGIKVRVHEESKEPLVIVLQAYPRNGQ